MVLTPLFRRPGEKEAHPPRTLEVFRTTDGCVRNLSKGPSKVC
jgi:hypothetical protein